MSAVGILLGRFDHDQALLARAAAPDGLVDRSISAFVREGAADAPAPADAEGYKIADPVRGFMEAELHELRARFRELLENYETVMLERSELHERTVALQARAATCDLLHCPSGGLTAGVRGSHVVVSYGKQSTDVFAEGAAKVEEGSEAIALETQRSAFVFPAFLLVHCLIRCCCVYLYCRIKEGVVMETPDVLQVSPEVTSPAITKMLLMLQSDLAVAKVVIDSAPDNHTVIVDEKTVSDS
ncbi:MAG: hypothetical protein P4L40_21925 [Terracidiphilus sp.]|nr:hypothetical protein [Terracidiphilus sp.]